MRYLALAMITILFVSGCVAPEKRGAEGAQQPDNVPQGSGVQTQPPRNVQQENSDVVYDYPTACKPYLGFDNYRTEQAFAINPANSSEMYVNVEFKGLYKSTDKGKAWKFSGRGIKGWPRADDPKKPCYMLSFDLYIDPANPDRVLLPGGSAPGKISEPRFQTGGLRESLDAGKSWHQLFSGDMNAYTGHVVTDPRNPDIIYVETAALPSSNTEADPDAVFVTKGIVYKSADGGKTWDESPTGLVKDMRATGIFLDQTNPDHILLATMALRVGTDTGKQASSEQSGLLQTKDGGRTWTKIESTSGIAIRFVDISTANFEHIFIYGGPMDNERAIYSLDGGNSFNEVQAQVNFARFDPNNGMRLIGLNIYTQPDDLFESLDGGKTWDAVGKLPKEATNDYRVSNIVFDKNDENAIYLNGDMGRIWRTTNKGKTWEMLLSVEKLETPV